MADLWEDKDDPTQEDWDRWDSLSNEKVFAEFISLGCIVFERFDSCTLRRICESMISLTNDMERTSETN